MSSRKFNLLDPEPDVRSKRFGTNTVQCPALPCPALPTCEPACLRTAHLPPQPCPSPWEHTKRYPDILATSESRARACLDVGALQPAWPACDQSGGTVCAPVAGVHRPSSVLPRSNAASRRKRRKAWNAPETQPNVAVIFWPRRALEQGQKADLWGFGVRMANTWVS